MTELQSPRLLSVVIPAYDEEHSVEPLHEELLELARAQRLSLEIIWIDDGSTDGTWSALERIVARDPCSRALRLRRNFGKTAALVAALAEARGDVIVTLDADGQDVPAEIPKLLERLDAGADVVTGWKRPRRDPLTKVLPSRAFNLLVGLTSGLWLKEHNSGLKAIRAHVFDEVRLYGNLHRFIPVLARARGFVVHEVAVRHRARRHGRSKYGAWRFVVGLLDLALVTLSTDPRGRPQKALGALGLLCAALGAGALGYLGVSWLTQFSAPESYKPLTERPLLFYALGALVVGAQMATLGIISGLLPAATSARPEAHYSVRERIGGVDGGADDRPRLRLERIG